MRCPRIDMALEGQIVLARDLDVAAVAALAAALGAGAAGVAGPVVRPDNEAAAVAVRDRVGVQLRVCHDEGLVGVADVWTGTVEVAADADRAAASVARRVDPGAVVEQDVLALHGHRTAAFAGAESGRVEVARYSRDALAAAVDDDAPLARAYRLRLDDAAHVEDGVGKGAARRSAQFDRASIGLDAAELREPVLRFGGAGLEEEQAVAFDIDGHGVRRHEADPSAVGGDRAAVGDAGACEHDEAARRRNRALIDDGATLRGGGRIYRGQAVAARKKVVVGHRQRRDDQAADVDARACAEHHAVGIEQEDLPVRRHLPEDVRGVVAGHAVERHRGARRLVEADLFTGRDREALPVDDRLVARLSDDFGGRARRADRGIAGHDLAALRQGPRHA